MICSLSRLLKLTDRGCDPQGDPYGLQRNNGNPRGDRDVLHKQPSIRRKMCVGTVTLAILLSAEGTDKPRQHLLTVASLSDELVTARNVETMEMYSSLYDYSNLLVKRLLRQLQPCLSGEIEIVQQQTSSVKATKQVIK